MPRIVPTLPGFLTIVLAGVLAPSLVQASCAPASGVMASVAVFVGTQAAPVAATQVSNQESMRQEATSALASMKNLEDADTALSFAQEGAALYEREKVKLDGYDYCSQAVELAEQGEFRESARAASKQLLVLPRQHSRRHLVLHFVHYQSLVGRHHSVLAAPVVRLDWLRRLHFVRHH